MLRQRRKKGRPISGWIVLDKPKGLASTEAVSKARWFYNAEKAGHAGTLDPLASGLLPIAFGEATKTVPYIMANKKIYRCTIAWGEERSTDDLEGKVIKSSCLRPTEMEIKAFLPKYIGLILQVPPQFSAIKIDGTRAYDLARNGKKIDMLPREVEINKLEFVEITPNGHAILRIKCGKGTYIRSLARDLGRDLGCYGYVADLRRTEVTPFTEENVVTLEKLEEACLPYIESVEGNKPVPRRDFSKLDALLIETSAALKCLPQYSISKEQVVNVRDGNPIVLRGYNALEETNRACVNYKGRVLAIGYIEKTVFKPKKLFCL
ncbi:MAG: tRNA pseudouridine55 synthase [Candidatus Tokpelaia sp. JSC188]|nr:MAG: tRNA pseudouridine55 synthase [Candidatus Tokpelaia sp. JSC188]